VPTSYEFKHRSDDLPIDAIKMAQRALSRLTDEKEYI
jgi:hypothetical protein